MSGRVSPGLSRSRSQRSPVFKPVKNSCTPFKSICVAISTSTIPINRSKARMPRGRKSRVRIGESTSKDIVPAQAITSAMHHSQILSGFLYGCEICSCRRPTLLLCTALKEESASL